MINIETLTAEEIAQEVVMVQTYKRHTPELELFSLTDTMLNHIKIALERNPMSKSLLPVQDDLLRAATTFYSAIYKANSTKSSNLMHAIKRYNYCETAKESFEKIAEIMQMCCNGFGVSETVFKDIISVHADIAPKLSGFISLALKNVATAKRHVSHAQSVYDDDAGKIVLQNDLF